MRLQTQIHDMKLITTPVTPSEQAIFSVADLTLLDRMAKAAAIEQVIDTACLHHVAAICVFPEHLTHMPPLGDIQRATVVNFPSGNEATQHVLEAIEQVCHHTDEIDYVFPYQAYLSGKKSFALAACRDTYEFCKKHNLTFKVIIETGALPSLALTYNLCTALLDQGCDFIKTSTGKHPVGATIPAAFVILAAIKDRGASCGIKVSGGIKTRDTALSYIQLAEHMRGISVDKSWFRIGTSALSFKSQQ